MKYLAAIFILLFAHIVKSQVVNTGVATYFDGLGAPYGGCGVPQDKLETQNFVALNVFDTPGSGTQYPRPVSDNNAGVIGAFENGNNCGRWLKVTILENCNGTNDGALGQQFCRGTGSAWVTDKFVGAELNMIVADACGDANGWCRDSPYHLDLMKTSLTKFSKNGTPTTDMYPTSWNNRKVKWEYIPAPNYTGDIKIHFMKDAQKYYSPILITNLKNGIHGIEQKVGSSWIAAKRFSDMGQAFILSDNNSPFRIRIIDAEDQYVNQGSEYVFSFPISCNPNCTPPTTEVPYQVFNVISGLDAELLTSPSFWLQNLNGETTLSWSGINTGINTIKVFDMMGKEQKTWQISSQSGSMPIEHLSQGIFNVSLYTHGNITNTKRFIVD